MYSVVNASYLGYSLLAQHGIDSMDIEVCLSMTKHCSINTNPTVSLCGCLIVCTAEEETMLFKMEDMKEQREGERRRESASEERNRDRVGLDMLSSQYVIKNQC